MGCIDQKLGSGVIKLVFSLFFVKFTTKSIDKIKENSLKILVLLRNIGPVSSLVSVLPTQWVFST